MARPIKSGLDYFPLDVKIDQKIKFIQQEYGCEGFAVVIKLYQEIYQHGYYLTMNTKRLKLFAYENHISLDIAKKIFNSCLEEKIFNEKLYNEYRIITSKGIQKRYFTAIKGRRVSEIIKDYLLISPKDFVHSKMKVINICLKQSVSEDSLSETNQPKEEPEPPKKRQTILKNILIKKLIVQTL